MIKKQQKLRFFGICILAVWVACGTGHASRAEVAQTLSGEAVILLHGLGRSHRSMSAIGRYLTQEGYWVENLGYPSLQASIEEISGEYVAGAVRDCRARGFERIHFVTHSMGALVLRHYLQDHHLPAGSRIVMLAPPNEGSELADWALTHANWLSRLAGPGAAELHTGAGALHARLDPISAEVGVLMGYRSWNPFFSTVLPGMDDGKVTVTRARLTEMQDFLLVPANHTTILLKGLVHRQAAHFLQTGRFLREINAGSAR